MWLVIGIIEMVIFVQYAIVVKFLCIHVLSLFSPCIVYNIEVYGYIVPRLPDSISVSMHQSLKFLWRELGARIHNSSILH